MPQPEAFQDRQQFVPRTNPMVMYANLSFRRISALYGLDDGQSFLLCLNQLREIQKQTTAGGAYCINLRAFEGCAGGFQNLVNINCCC